MHTLNECASRLCLSCDLFGLLLFLKLRIERVHLCRGFDNLCLECAQCVERLLAHLLRAGLALQDLIVDDFRQTNERGAVVLHGTLELERNSADECVIACALCGVLDCDSPSCLHSVGHAQFANCALLASENHLERTIVAGRFDDCDGTVDNLLASDAYDICAIQHFKVAGRGVVGDCLHDLSFCELMTYGRMPDSARVIT